MRLLRELLKGERGQALAIAALGMVVVGGFAALAVDVGIFLHERREIQNAADAAALAGAVELPEAPAEAEARVLEWAEKNGIDIAGGELEAIEVITTYVTDDTVRVQLKRDTPFVFGRVLGLTDNTMHATAAARVGSPSGVGGVSPWGVRDDDLVYGEQVTLKYDAQDNENGNFQPLAIDGPGASIYRDTVKYGAETVLCTTSAAPEGCPSVVSTEPGNLVGPTNVGVDYLMDNTDGTCDEFEELFIPHGDSYYVDPDCNPFPPDYNSEASKRVVIVPMIDDLCNGSCDVNIVRFGLMFLDSYSCSGGEGHCEVVGRFVKAAITFSGLLAPLDPESSLRMVRLIE
jgi:hypothetical protein